MGLQAVRKFWQIQTWSKKYVVFWCSHSVWWYWSPVSSSKIYFLKPIQCEKASSCKAYSILLSFPSTYFEGHTNICKKKIELMNQNKTKSCIIVKTWQRFLFYIRFSQLSSLYFSRIWLKTVMSQQWQWREPLSRFQPRTFPCHPLSLCLSSVFSTGNRCSTFSNPFQVNITKRKHKHIISSSIHWRRLFPVCNWHINLTVSMSSLSKQKESKKLIPTQSSPIPQSQ